MIAIIQAVEVPGNGLLKLMAVVNIVQGTFESMNQVAGMIGADKVQPWMEKIVGVVVGFLNATGAFKKQAA